MCASAANRADLSEPEADQLEVRTSTSLAIGIQSADGIDLGDGDELREGSPSGSPLLV
jgi:hypothetical protein